MLVKPRGHFNAAQVIDVEYFYFVAKAVGPRQPGQDAPWPDFEQCQFSLNTQGIHRRSPADWLHQIASDELTDYRRIGFGFSGDVENHRHFRRVKLNHIEPG